MDSDPQFLTLSDLLDQCEGAADLATRKMRDTLMVAVVEGIEARSFSLLKEKFLDKKNVSKWAKSIAHTLSNPGKMPCFSYSISAIYCKMGSKLVSVEGSVCEGCYALRNRYRMPNVQQALEKRFKSLDDPDWVLAMAVQITWKCESLFRWHDSGDVQSVYHLAMICAVARLTPHISHWIPTRERGILYRFLRAGGVIPDNLIIRLSGTKRDEGPPILGQLRELGVRTSTVHEHEEPWAGSHDCPTEKQGGRCLSCRACWSRGVVNVSYHWH